MQKQARIFIGFLFSLMLTTYTYAYPVSSGGIVREFTADDVEISEYYSGATWSADSQKVYFARCISIELKKESQDNALMSEMLKMEADYSAGKRDLSDAGMPSKFLTPLFDKDIIYEYDISTKTLKIITEFFSSNRSQPTTFFFAPSLDNNKIRFSSTYFMHWVDVSTGKESREELAAAMHKEINLKFVERKDKVIVKDDSNQVVALRYISPSGSSSIEIPEYTNAVNPPGCIKIDGRLLQKDLFYTAEEKGIRNKLGF